MFKIGQKVIAEHHGLVVILGERLLKTIQGYTIVYNCMIPNNTQLKSIDNLKIFMKTPICFIPSERKEVKIDESYLREITLWDKIKRLFGIKYKY